MALQKHAHRVSAAAAPYQWLHAPCPGLRPHSPVSTLKNTSTAVALDPAANSTSVATCGHCIPLDQLAVHLEINYNTVKTFNLVRLTNPVGQDERGEEAEALHWQRSVEEHLSRVVEQPR